MWLLARIALEQHVIAESFFELSLMLSEEFRRTLIDFLLGVLPELVQLLAYNRGGSVRIR